MLISEMTLEQLQDYAVKRDEEIASYKDNESKMKTQIEELSELNKALQRRNNDLFLRVEQAPAVDNTPKPEIKTESCEDFARRLILGGK